MRLDALKVAIGTNLFFLFATLAGQGTFPDLVENAYGLDQDLVNGIQYSNRYMRSEGNPYFQEDSFKNGSVSINGKIYQNVQLKYDLFSQRVEIKHDKILGRNYRYITISDRMEAFSLGAYEFRKLNIQENPERYYQVINTGHFTCLVHWEKKLVPLDNSAIYIDHFTHPRFYYWLELKKGAATDVDGRFSLVIKPGKYTIDLNCMGMEHRQNYLEVLSGGNLTISMKKRLVPITEVVIQANKYHNEVPRWDLNG